MTIKLFLLLIASSAAIYTLSLVIFHCYNTYMNLYRAGSNMAHEIAESHKKAVNEEFINYYKSLDPVGSYSKVMARNENVVVVNFMNRQNLKLKAMGLKK